MGPLWVLLQIIAYEGSERNPVMSRVLLTHEIMCRFATFAISARISPSKCFHAQIFRPFFSKPCTHNIKHWWFCFCYLYKLTQSIFAIRLWYVKVCCRIYFVILTPCVSCCRLWVMKAVCTTKTQRCKESCSLMRLFAGKALLWTPVELHITYRLSTHPSTLIVVYVFAFIVFWIILFHLFFPNSLLPLV